MLGHLPESRKGPGQERTLNFSFIPWSVFYWGGSKGNTDWRLSFLCFYHLNVFQCCLEKLMYSAYLNFPFLYSIISRCIHSLMFDCHSFLLAPFVQNCSLPSPFFLFSPFPSELHTEFCFMWLIKVGSGCRGDSRALVTD